MVLSNFSIYFSYPETSHGGGSLCNLEITLGAKATPRRVRDFLRIRSCTPQGEEPVRAAPSEAGALPVHGVKELGLSRQQLPRPGLKGCAPYRGRLAYIKKICASTSRRIYLKSPSLH